MALRPGGAGAGLRPGGGVGLRPGGAALGGGAGAGGGGSTGGGSVGGMVGAGAGVGSAPGAGAGGPPGGAGNVQRVDPNRRGAPPVPKDFVPLGKKDDFGRLIYSKTELMTYSGLTEK